MLRPKVHYSAVIYIFNKKDKHTKIYNYKVQYKQNELLISLSVKKGRRLMLTVLWKVTQDIIGLRVSSISIVQIASKSKH